MREFTIPGEPKGKGRPRFTTAHGYVKAITPTDTVSYENLVRLMYKTSVKEPMYEQSVPIVMHISAYYGIPKSVSNKKRTAMLEGKIRPTKKPDIDNICKIIMDSLNGIAYHDDAQIVMASVDKHYSDNPRVSVCMDTYHE
jgi:Holliday junction resolvase RusA-like endonuclease